MGEVLTSGVIHSSVGSVFLDFNVQSTFFYDFYDLNVQFDN